MMTTAVVYEISKGNPGALNVLAQLISHGREGEAVASNLAGRGFLGSALWVAYKDGCAQDCDRLIAEHKTQRLVDVVNQAIAMGDCGNMPPVKVSE